MPLMRGKFWNPRELNDEGGGGRRIVWKGGGERKRGVRKRVL